MGRADPQLPVCSRCKFCWGRSWQIASGVVWKSRPRTVTETLLEGFDGARSSAASRRERESGGFAWLAFEDKFSHLEHDRSVVAGVKGW